MPPAGISTIFYYYFVISWHQVCRLSLCTENQLYTGHEHLLSFSKGLYCCTKICLYSLCFPAHTHKNLCFFSQKTPKAKLYGQLTSFNSNHRKITTYSSPRQEIQLQHQELLLTKVSQAHLSSVKIFGRYFFFSENF